jgi:ribosomal protein S12 methylthiotransferase accessory factor
MLLTAKRFKRGTHRVSSPEETRSRVLPLLAPLGITRVANVTGLDVIGIPVVAVYRPNSRSLSVAQGKGTSLVAAEVSGIMESLEFFHAENVSEPLLFGSYEQLRYVHDLIDPALLPKNEVGRFSSDYKLHWIRGVDLVAEAARWVPYELVHTDFTLPLPQGSGCFPMTSNGLASGNHLWEAVSHGLSEVVERDAATLFSLLAPEQRAARRVDPESVDDAECRTLLQAYERAGVKVALFDMTSDTQIAVFRAVIADRELDPARPLAPSTGTGCHPSRNIALSRALTEAAQARLTVIAGSRDDLPRERYDDAADLTRLHRERERIMNGMPRRSFAAAPTFEGESIGEDVAWQKERLLEAGVQSIVVVDLTKPEFGIPVARVLVPELEPARDVPGWVPGRRAHAAIARRAA